MKLLLEWRRPQITVCSLLIVVAVCGIAIGWVTWPANTARAFQSALAKENAEKLTNLLDLTETEIHEILRVCSERKKPLTIELNPRSLEDVMTGRQHFLVGNCYRGVAVRGSVKNLHRPIFISGFEIKRCDNVYRVAV